MKTRIFSMLIIVGGLALLLMLATAAQGTIESVVVPSAPPTPLPIEVASPVHIPYNPFLRSDTLPEYPPDSKLHPSSLRPQPVPTKPAGIDLDVTYISRTPMYNHYDVWYTSDGKPYLQPGTENLQRWPSPGEIVTFTAHIMNKGTVASGDFTFKWFIDGAEARNGVHHSLAPGEESIETYEWAWMHTLDGERLIGSHAVRFAVNPSNSIPETYETNNSLEDRTDALSLVIALTPELYTILETPVDPKWPFSAEDWIQKQIAAMNAAFARSIYTLAPDGVHERVRVDKILVSATAPQSDPAEDGGFWMLAQDRRNNAYYDPVTDIDGALIHELTHQLVSYQ